MFTTVAALNLLFATVPIVLNFRTVQNYLIRSIADNLSTTLQTKVTVGHVDYALFNSIELNDLFIADQQKDTLLYVQNASAHFSFWKLFLGKVRITSAGLNRVYGNIVVDRNGKTNINFLIKALTTSNNNNKSVIEYHVKRFILQNSSFSYTDTRQSVRIPPNQFNSAKIRITALNTELTLNILKKDTVSAELKKLTFKEKSGLTVTSITAQLYGSDKGAFVPSIEIRMPDSHLSIKNIRLTYDSLADFNHFINRVRISAPIKPSYIALSDLKAFIPGFSHVKGGINLRGTITGMISNLRFQKLEVSYGKGLLLNTDLDVNGLPNLNEAFIYANINQLSIRKNELQDFIADLTRQPFILPTELNRLGTLHYKGNISGFLSNMVAYGNLNTALGSISTDILIQLGNQLRDLSYNGTIKSSGFRLGELVDNKSLGTISFKLNTKGSKLMHKQLQGTIMATVPEVQFNNYSYRAIDFKGKYDGTGFNGQIAINDDNINAKFNGIIDLTQKLPIFNFRLNVQKANLNALKITNKYPGAILSFNGNTNMVGNSLDNINGFVQFDSIRFMNKNKTLHSNQIRFVSRIDSDLTHFIISSDYINGSLDGKFRYSTIGYTFGQLVQKYLPSLSPSNNKKNNSKNHINIDLKISNIDNLADILGFPYKLEGTSTIKGFLDDPTGNVNLQASVPSFKSNNLFIENISLICENPDKQLKITTRGILHNKDELENLYLISTAAKDTLTGQMGWQNNKEVTNAGEIQAIMKFSKQYGQTTSRLTLLPTQIIINDSIWDIHRCNIEFRPDSSIAIHNFRFNSNDQFIHLDGIASESRSDSLAVQMNKIKLDFIFGLLKLKAISIGGLATGNAVLRSVLKEPIFNTRLFVKDVTLNEVNMGDARIHGNWNKLTKCIDAGAVFLKEQMDTIATANGVYVPSNDSVDFIFDTKKLPVAFLQPYFKSVVEGFSGYGSGRIRMLGPTKIIGFEGDEMIHDGQASVKMLGTTYFFSDSVHLTRKTISFNNITLYDKEHNTGSMSGILHHDGSFRGMDYNVTMQSNNIIGLNTHAQDNDYFFGKAYARGTVRIFGDEKAANIVVNAVSQPKTQCYIQMGGASSASDNSFISFVNPRLIDPEIKKAPATTNPESNFNVKVNLQLEVTPDASMEMIVDPKGGDKITGRGEGNLRIEFDTFSDIKLYGTYVINSGDYLFTMQNLFLKKFKIDQGSTLSWTGNPYHAKVNIRAIYPLNASLKDLATNQLSDNMRSTVPVNCILMLSDDLMKPTIRFDLDLPQSDEGVKQLVKNIVNTDEMMNRQILYLLVFNKFYTPDYMRTATTNTNLATNEGLSLVTSTVSAQINSWLSQMVNNVSFGIDYQKSNETPTGGEYQAQILYQPNNRLIINGNIGYRTDNLATTTNRFVGDVDLEYLLNQSGNLRFKAYNHTVDRYYLSSSMLSQGLGFVYKEDFATVDDMFRYYWHLLSGEKKESSKNITKEPAKDESSKK